MQICAQAREWVRQAGAIARERFGHVEVWRKQDSSPVTDADVAVQDALLETIGRYCPADAVITEETQSAPEQHQQIADARRCWVIDPIDGTRNYARGIPVFTIAVALMEAGRPVVGVVHNPITGLTYHAAAGSGAWVDDRRVTLRAVPEPEELYISVPTSKDEGLPAVVHRWIDTYVVRNLGSTALHLALLANGSLDAVYCRRAKLWDIAAGAIIAFEAGAKLLSCEGRPWFPMDLTGYSGESIPFIAARAGLLERLLAEYQQAEGSR